MKIKIQKIKHFIKDHYIISGIMALIIILIGYNIFGGNNGNFELFTVAKTNVVQKVIVNGKSKPVSQVDLGFEINGKVSASFVDIGSRVGVGQSLVSLNSAELQANLLKWQASLLSEEAKLDELKNGTRPEEITIAEIAMTNARAVMSAEMLDSYTKSDDAIYNSVDQLFSNPRTTAPQFNLSLTDSQLKSDINNGRVVIENILINWSKYFVVSKENINKTESNLLEIKSFLDKIALAVNQQSASGSITQATIDAYKAAISGARTNITTSISSIATSESTLVSAEATLYLKQNGSTAEVIAAQEAKVMQAKAEVQNAQAQISKTVLRSPLYGIVTKQDAKVGEIVTPGKVVISIISDNNLEIEADVSEINIGKVLVGNVASIIFDAFPGEVFKGTVTYIEPAETIVDGVVNYKVTVAFNEKYSQIKSGLTAKLEIETAVKNDVLSVPQYSLIKKDSDTFVSKQVGNSFEEVKVAVGIIGQEGMAEILSGLREGDIIKALSE